MNLRLATIEDAQLLLSWRNDSNTIANSKVSHRVNLSDHLIWLKSSIENPNRELYIAELDGKSVGTVRVDYCHESQYCELSWTIAPNSRGQGLGKSMVGLMACKIDYQIFAEIKQGNIESARIAESVGMQLKCTENCIMYWRN